MSDWTPEMREALAEKVRESRRALARFPSWITTGSQQDFDEWYLHGQTPQASLEAIERFKGNGG